MSEAPASGRITAEIMPLTMAVLRCPDTVASGFCTSEPQASVGVQTQYALHGNAGNVAANG